MPSRIHRFNLPPLALILLAVARSLAAQTTTPATSNPKERDVVTLSPFFVHDSATRIGRYTSLESTSAGRVRADVIDSSQSISVITEEMIEDIAPGRIVDVALYVAGVSDSTLPTSWERINMRGFQADGRTVDGITYAGGVSSGAQNIDPAIIERIEIVKGPNSILAPQAGSPGGTINNETKKPRFRDFGFIGLRWGQFDANSGFLDVNRVLNDKLAVRFVGSERNWDNGWKGSHLHSSTLMPALMYRFSRRAQATVQYVYTNWKASNYFGVPLDPTSGSTTPARILDGVPRDLHAYPADAFRATRQHEFKLFFTAELPKGIQTRLVAAYNTNTQHVTQIAIGNRRGGDGGSVDPLTGLWNYGVSYASTPPYAPSPIATRPTRTFTRSGSELLIEPRQLNLQNDYAYRIEHGSLRSMTVAGFAYREQRAITRNYTLDAPEFDIDHYVETAWTRRSGTGRPVPVDGRFRQGYFSENLALFRNRLILNAAESWQTYPRSGRKKQVSSHGAVIKPAGDAVSLYFGYNEQSSSLNPLTDAQQNEFGTRIKVWKNTLYFTVARFDIAQANFRVTNPLRPTDTPIPQPAFLLSDVKSKGWEYEVRANPTKSLSIVGSYTHLKSRDPNNVEFRGVPETTGGVFASYAFGRENLLTLAGLRVAVGVNYVSKRPGDTAMGLTDANVPIQPSFYLGARTLVNLTLAYNSKHQWGVQVNVDNAFDRKYLLTGVNRSMVFTGTPRNIGASVKYGF
ncbi:MAG: TonB-dependent siderophore receptor [Opitutaceae bacterium]